ncbi:MAG: hypothetical protein J6W52_00060 [Bacteroidaceae bacterium]|nr:hypothetical protein [Bacteroidaceae bacterium]
MKKTFKSILLATLGVFAFTCCEDVPAPYEIPGSENQQGTATNTFYASTSCNDWSMLAAETGNNPWSQGSSYTQATGYQKWDGADAKSNRMADGYLISPGFSTVTDSTTAYISFQYCVGYANNDAQFADHIKLYASTQYAPADGFVAEKWTQLDWKATHTSTSWELETTTVMLPAEFLNKEKVNIALYFTTPNETKSSTFEIKDFKAVAGKPTTGDSGNSEETPASSSKEKPLTIAQAKTGNGNNYVKGFIVGYIDGTKLEEGARFDVPTSAETEILLADTPDETSPANVFPVQLPPGAIREALELSIHPEYLKKEVLLYGSLETYFGITGMKSTSWGSIEGTTFGKDPDNTNTETATPEGDGTLEKPFNVAAVISYVTELGADITSPKEVYVKGIVKSNNTTEATISQYGNMNFIMIDEGFENAEFQAYQVYGLGNKRFTSPDDIKVGDEVIVYGKVVNYKGNTPETTGKGSAYVYSLNGNTESGDEGDNNQGDEQQGDDSEYAINLSYTGGTNFYDNGVATINGVADCKVLKIGTSKAPGNFSLTVPAGKHSFYAITWKGTEPADVVLKNGEEVIKTVTVQPNDGATSNSPYTITVTEDDKYEFEVATDCTVTVTSEKRIIFFGIK